MNDATSKQILKLIEEKDYDAAVGKYRELAKRRFLFPAELVELGELLQLESNETGPLQEVEDVFRSALEIDQEFVPALLALGWFNFAVMDHTTKAVQIFEKALALIRALEAEAQDGLERCREELREDEGTS